MNAKVIGCSGAVWLDVDGDGRKTSARDYARRLFVAADGDLAVLLDKLKPFDAAVAAQAAYLTDASGASLLRPDTANTWRNSAPQTRAGFDAYLNAWREHQQASRE